MVQASVRPVVEPWISDRELCLPRTFAPWGKPRIKCRCCPSTILSILFGGNFPLAVSLGSVLLKHHTTPLSRGLQELSSYRTFRPLDPPAPFIRSRLEIFTWAARLRHSLFATTNVHIRSCVNDLLRSRWNEMFHPKFISSPSFQSVSPLICPPILKSSGLGNSGICLRIFAERRSRRGRLVMILEATTVESLGILADDIQPSNGHLATAPFRKGSSAVLCND
ncbi:uncharacterized protein EI90DRAFT_2089970 [Cantharellus anzutake]|uniref:uncharacterized protein n=1 Tax=Cantharellus anzutake TaxID=1750568 RepID=UPI001907DEF1|nr:uncharacterized protein EI90DRAFT_2089970 [Cantharellus anzutake]KAF8340630.1 hypothetical protein EI90DRAFT_2089970 [Cantharellus anzutake]